jgi:hypothetical protein
VSLKDRICELIADYWLNVNQYCGIPSYYLIEKIENKEGIIEDKIKEILTELEKEGYLSTREIEGGDRIKIIWDDNKFRKIIEPGPHLDLWAYPKRKLLEKYDDSKVEDVGLFTKQLKLGGSQLEHRFFRRQVLDRYRDDPRFLVEEWGADGTLTIKDKYFLDENTPEDEKISIQTFGYAYDLEDQQVIAVILVDLGRLSVKHQNHWHSFEIEVPCKLDPDYIETNFEAKWTDRVAIYQAFCTELDEINKICSMMEQPPLFRETYLDRPPPKFGRLTISTKAAFNEFVQLLDKLISDNFNKDFFKGKVELTEEIEIDNGKKIVDRGTLQLLDDYLNRYWRFPDPEPKDEMIKVFKEIRKGRQIPAHNIVDDEYDEEILQRQRDLMMRAYKSIRTLRLILKNHPKATYYSPPRWLDEGRII